MVHRPDGEAPEDIGTGHPMREVTEQVARDPSSWTRDLAGRVAGLFDGLAPTWHLNRGAAQLLPLVDALDRGGPLAGPVVELGAGDGAGTTEIVARHGAVVALDLSWEMLCRLDVDGAGRVLADASRLPFPDGSIGTLVCVNMLLFAGEVRRVLGPAGALVWVNTIGERTPIHLPADAVAASLGEGFEVVASRAGWGTWAVARRAVDPR